MDTSMTLNNSILVGQKAIVSFLYEKTEDGFGILCVLRRKNPFDEVEKKAELLVFIWSTF